MKIIIDAYQFATNITGTDRMARNFLIELQKLDTKNSYTVITSQVTYIPSIIKGSNFRIIGPPKFMSLPFIGRYALWAWRKMIYPYLRLLHVDVFFSFHNMKLPPKRIAKKQIASNLDLIPLVLDEYTDLANGGREQVQKDYLHVVENADAFMSISQYSADELHDILGVPYKKISVIPLAVDSSLSGTKITMQLPKNFIFTIGGSEPRKNVALIVDAHCRLPEHLQKKYPLYIAGGPWHGRSLQSLEKTPFIHTLGYVSDAQLTHLYTKASLFVFASTYEGFGFTILEAMSLGTPVLSSKGSSLTEVVGAAAQTFDPLNGNELLKKLERLLVDQELRNTLSQKGKRQAKQFSWEKSAQKLLQLLTD